MNPINIKLNKRSYILLVVFLLPFVKGFSQCLADDETVDIVTDISYTGPHYFSKSVYVIHELTTVTMDAALIEFAEGSSIRLAPTAKLIIKNGSVLSSHCGKTWKGIEVSGDSTEPRVTSAQGYVEISGATLQDAECAVRAYDGGLVNATNSQFLDNINSITIEGVFQPYSFAITDCDFYWVNYNRAGYTQQVKLSNVYGISLLGCRFKTQTHNQGIGILSTDCNLTVGASGTLIPNSYPLRTSGRRATFEGFYNAIVDYATGDNWLKVLMSDFLNNIQGIRSEGNVQLYIDGNTFNTNDGAPADMYQGFYVPIKDIYIYHSKASVLISNNEFKLSRSEGFLPPLNYIPSHITHDACSFTINILKNNFTCVSNDGWGIIPIVINHHTTTSTNDANIYCNNFSGYRNDIVFKHSIGFVIGSALAPANNFFSENNDYDAPYTSIVADSSEAINYYKENPADNSRKEPVYSTNVFVNNAMYGVIRDCSQPIFNQSSCPECLTLSDNTLQQSDKSSKVVFAKNLETPNAYTLVSAKGHVTNTMVVINLSGQPVYETELNIGETIQLTGLQKGLYVYSIKDAEQMVTTGKLIIE